MSNLGKKYFQNLFKTETQASIEEVAQVAQFFPRFFDEADNRLLMEEFTEKELLEVLHSFQKDKILGPDGWTIDFSLGCYEVLGPNFLNMIEDTIISS
jgi:hypothetical protein